jgi:cyclophilin family peptidyl-prolyl cis-trans isomerase
MGRMIATLQTTAGDIRIELFPNHAPVTVANFTGLATGAKEWKDPMTGDTMNDPFYDGLVFHRVIEGFMIQGGCPLGTGTGGPGYTFDDEPHPELSFNEPYLLAMAGRGPTRSRESRQAPTVLSSSSPSTRPHGSTASTPSLARSSTMSPAPSSTRSPPLPPMPVTVHWRTS